MASIPQSELPPPKSWDDFEDLVCGLHRTEAGVVNAQRYGRQGQAQNGVDIVIEISATASVTAIQCKRYAEGKLSVEHVRTAIVDAEKFAPAIGEFVIATTERRNALLQSEVLKINQERAGKKSFLVRIEFWEDIIDRLTDPVCRDLLYKFYGDWIKGFESGIRFGKSEIGDYIKTQIDAEVLGVVKQVLRFFHARGKLTPQAVSDFLSRDFDWFCESLAENSALGFHLLKRWDFHIDQLELCMRNPLIVVRLSDNQLSPIAAILRSLVGLSTIREMRELFEPKGEGGKNLKIVRGAELGSGNEALPNRHILLESVGDDKFLVLDFGDFRDGDVGDLLRVFSIKTQHIYAFAERITDLVGGINRWIEASGGEFMLDPRHFRIARGEK